jgi:hypothetical protein
MLSKNVIIKGVSGLAAVLCLVGTANLTLAAAFTLQDQRSTASGSLPNATPYSASDGVTYLSRNDPPAPADHIQDLVQQWYFFRTGAGPNQSIGALNLISSSLKDLSIPADGLNEQLSATYGNADNSVQIAVTYNLIGSAIATYQTQLSRNVKVITTAASPASISVFSFTELKPTQIQSPASGQYSQEPGNLTVQMSGMGMDVQHFGVGGLVTDILTSTDPVNVPSRYQVAADPAGITALLAKLNGGTGDLSTLFTSPSSLPVTGGSVAYAFQYDLLGGVSNTYITTESLLVTPEPASLLLLGLGGSLLVLGRRTRKA